MNSNQSLRSGGFGVGEGWARFLRFAILCSIPAICISLAYLLISERIAPLYVVAIAAGLAALALSLRASSNSTALLAAVAAGGLLGFIALPTGTESKIPISLVIVAMIAGFWLLQIVTHQAGRPILRPSPLNVAVLAFVGANIVSFIWSTLIRDPLVWTTRSFVLVQLAALLVNCLLPLVILVAINKIDSITFWRRAVWLVLMIGLVGIWSEIYAWPIAVITNNGMRGLFSMWAFSFALALLLFQSDTKWFQKIALLLIVAGFVWRNVFLNTVWLSGWVPMVVALPIILWFRSKWLVVLAAFVALALLAYYAGGIYQNVVQSNLDEGSGSRILIWEIALEHVRAHPLFGSGPAGYAAYYMAYHAAEARSTHNNFFDVLAQTGIVGLLLFVNLAVQLGRTGLRNVRLTRTNDNGFVRAFAVTTLAGIPGLLAGMMLGDWVLPFAYNQTITGFDNSLVTWLFMGGIGSLYWLLQHDSCAPSPLSQDNAPLVSANAS